MRMPLLATDIRPLLQCMSPNWHQAAQNDVRCYVGFWGLKRKCCKQNQFDAPDPKQS
jgi:hypothetical protein